MSLIQQYMQLEAQSKSIEERLEQLRGNDLFRREIEFKERLEALLKEFDKSARDAIEILDPTSALSAKQPASRVRRKRKLKVYKNPNTGEVVETRGGNQKTLKAWKDEFGSDTVESWLVRVEE